MITDKLKKGLLLITEPSNLVDVSFNRSVILLAEHTKSGSIGFILNKPLKYTISDLVYDIEADFTIYNGGPVEQNILYFIHNIPELISDSLEISDGIYWGGNFSCVRDLINQSKIKSKNIRFFLGYSGWDANQLENEMTANSWIVSTNRDENKLVGKSTTHFWKEKILELGGEYLIWSNAPENHNLN
jgi:putative transcriptional regulator